MVFADSLSKAGRLVELERMFWKHPRRSFATARLADRLGVHPRTVRKYLDELSACGRLPVTREDDGWRLVAQARMEVPPVRLLLEEAAALYLAARLLEHSIDEPTPCVRSAIARLADVVPSDISGAFEHLARRAGGRGSRFAGVFSVLARGWALGREVRLQYVPRVGHAKRYHLQPFLLEPSAVGSAVYVIGCADPPGEVRVLKLERIESAELTNATFEPPAPSELLERLDRAWGVWLSDEEPELVRLRFTRQVAERVRETRWHPTQRLTDGPDGGVEMTVRVASTVEILPWVLGWGATVHVLEPTDLRHRVADEHRRAAASYTTDDG